MIWGGNSLNKKTGEELEQALQAIPNNVTSLNLGNNDLDNKSNDELVQAFQAIPNNVTSLNLSGNSLHNKSEEELVRAFQAISNSVTSLDLSWNHLGNKTTAELTELFKTILANITTFHLSHNVFTEEQIKTLLTVLGSRKDLHLDFGKIQMSQELKEEIHAINMNQSLLGHLLNNSFFIQPKPASAPEPTLAATSSAQPHGH